MAGALLATARSSIELMDGARKLPERRDPSRRMERVYNLVTNLAKL